MPGNQQAALVFNRTVIKLAERAEALVDENVPLEFLCECGCMTLLQLSLAEYKSFGGALILGHTRQNKLRSS